MATKDARRKSKVQKNYAKILSLIYYSYFSKLISFAGCTVAHRWVMFCGGGNKSLCSENIIK